MKKGLIVIIILCLIGLLIGWFGGKYYYNHTNDCDEGMDCTSKKDTKDDSKNEKKEEKVKVSLDDEKIKFLTDLTLETYYYEQASDTESEIELETLFSDKKINVASLSTNFKMTMALSTIKVGTNTTSIPKETMVNAYKKVFGTTDVANSFESLLAGSHGKLTLDGDTYKWDRLDWGADGFFGKRLPYEAYKYDNRIEIDYIFANNNMDEALGNDNYTNVEYYAKDGKTVVFSYKFGNMDFDDDQAVLDNQAKFQHYLGTYAKGSNGDYYIVSVEPKN